MQMDDRESGLAALVENLQRQDLSYIEQARGIRSLLEKFSLRQEQAARLLGMSQSAVANKLRLLRHSNEVLEQLRRTGLSERHARALLQLPREEQKLEAIAIIAAQNMNVSQAEQYIRRLLEAPQPKPQKANIGAFLQHISQSLGRIQKCGIPAVSEQLETDSQIVLTITIPK